MVERLRAWTTTNWWLTPRQAKCWIVLACLRALLRVSHANAGVCPTMLNRTSLSTWEAVSMVNVSDQ